jgi:hypothetical protein
MQHSGASGAKPAKVTRSMNNPNVLEINSYCLQKQKAEYATPTNIAPSHRHGTGITAAVQPIPTTLTAKLQQNNPKKLQDVNRQLTIFFPAKRNISSVLKHIFGDHGAIFSNGRNQDCS